MLQLRPSMNRKYLISLRLKIHIYTVSVVTVTAKLRWNQSGTLKANPVDGCKGSASSGPSETPIRSSSFACWIHRWDSPFVLRFGAKSHVCEKNSLFLGQKCSMKSKLKLGFFEHDLVWAIAPESLPATWWVSLRAYLLMTWGTASRTTCEVWPLTWIEGEITCETWPVIWLDVKGNRHVI